MKLASNFSPLILSFLCVFTAIVFSSCGDDDEVILMTKEITYQFHNGQTVVSAPYAGVHPSTLMATMTLEAMTNGNTSITITLQNTISGETYNIHAHDSANPANTPNGTPYAESPNADIFARSVEGNGNTVSVTQEAKMSFAEITNTYAGFLVVHDPLQAVSTTDIGTFLIVSSFARDQAASSFLSTVYDYQFNMGQVAPAFAYSGSHANTLSASIRIDELANDRSRITIGLNNTLNGQTYHTHAHDMADPSTTPNNTPYLENPNADVFAFPIEGNGGTSLRTNISIVSYNEITSNYDGFFVVHDPLQTITTLDPTTYVILGIFAR